MYKYKLFLFYFIFLVFFNFSRYSYQTCLLSLCLISFFKDISCCRLQIIFKVKVYEKLLQEYHQSVKQFRSRNVRSDLDLACLQQLSADDDREQRINQNVPI